MEWGTQCSVWGADILEVTFQILVNYCTESAAHGPGTPASSKNSVLAALGTQEALGQLLDSRMKFPQCFRWMGVKRVGRKRSGGKGREIQCQGINFALSILQWKFPTLFSGYVIQKIQELPWCVFIYVLWILPTRGGWLWWCGDWEVT